MSNARGFCLGVVFGCIALLCVKCYVSHKSSSRSKVNDKYAMLVGEKPSSCKDVQKKSPRIMLLEDVEYGTVDFNWLSKDEYHMSRRLGTIEVDLDGIALGAMRFEDVGQSLYIEFTYNSVKYLLTAEVDHANSLVSIYGKSMPTTCPLDLRHDVKDFLLKSSYMSMRNMPYLKMPLSDVGYARECDEYVEVSVSRCKDIMLRFARKN